LEDRVAVAMRVLVAVPALWIVLASVGDRALAQRPATTVSGGMVPSGADVASDGEYNRALQAWDDGRYVEALEGLRRLLTGADGERYVERIALLTGELFDVVPIAPDARAPRFAPGGTMAAYEVGTGAARVTRLVVLQPTPRQAAELPGFGLVFSASGDSVAYFRVRATPEIQRARSAVESAVRASNRAAAATAQREAAALEARYAEVVVRDLRTGAEQAASDSNLIKLSLAFAPRRSWPLVIGARASGAARPDAFTVSAAGPGARMTERFFGAAAPGTDSVRTDVIVAAGGRFVMYSTAGMRPAVGIYDVDRGTTRVLEGGAFAVSADGRALVYLGQSGNENLVNVLTLGDTAQPVTVKRTASAVSAPTLSPDGSLVSFQMMPREDWELYVVRRDGSGEVRLTREIQHDVLPRFLDNDRLLGLMGESRHRRSYLYDVRAAERTRLFHNNSVRTIAPEYSWAPSPDGRRILIVADRDGNTVSAERGLYLMDLSRRVARSAVIARIDSNLVAERRLRADGERAFRAVADQVRRVVGDISVGRIYGHEKELFEFDSKHITQPGNRKAIGYLTAAYRSFGYDPQQQWFDARTPSGQSVRTANVVATLRGTENPELVYVVGSHFDSVPLSPGADDNTSGTAALLEAARVLAKHPLPATIVFVSFTGEEAGLLGSREFVRQAQASGMKVAGVLNNDMLGWANDHRLDNTIRYSNDGIRDIQHAAAMQFSRLITYDARYYQNTDAHSFYDAYGDIVGGIGSYPVLGNPHYHQPHDLLEMENHQLIAEVSKATTATLTLLASSPSRLTGLTVVRSEGGTAELRWNPSPERGVASYIVAYGPPERPMERRTTVRTPGVTLTGVASGTVVAVKAVNARGLEGWDWARVTIGAPAPVGAGR
jgi:Tol biopolymer transport system component